jgi:hypothetical protein
MALIGGGGTANTAGGNPSGVGTSINYIRAEDKTLAYAYSGAITIDASNEVVLDFTTTNEAIFGKLQLEFLGSAVDADDVLMALEMNGQPVIGTLYGTGANQGTFGPKNYQSIVVPPHTRVRVLLSMLSGGGSIELGVSLTGEVYA